MIPDHSCPFIAFSDYADVYLFLFVRAPSNTYDNASSNLLAGSNLDTMINQLMEMGGGSWDRDKVQRALRAAYNNPERAVEYLYSVCICFALHVFWIESNFLLVRDEFCLSQTLGYSSNSWSCCSSWCSRRKHNWSTSYRGSRSLWDSKQCSIKSFPAGLLLSWFNHCILKHVLTNCTIQQAGSNAGGGPLEFLRNNQQVLIV